MTTPRLIEREGRLYAHYAGPWTGGPGERPTRVNHAKAREVIEHNFAAGTFDATDKPIVHNGAVYVLYK